MNYHSLTLINLSDRSYLQKSILIYHKCLDIIMFSCLLYKVLLPHSRIVTFSYYDIIIRQPQLPIDLPRKTTVSRTSSFLYLVFNSVLYLHSFFKQIKTTSLRSMLIQLSHTCSIGISSDIFWFLFDIEKNLCNICNV